MKLTVTAKLTTKEKWIKVHRHIFTYLSWSCRALCCKTNVLPAWISGCPKIFSDFQGFFFSNVSVFASLSSFSGTQPMSRLPSLSWISSFLCLPHLELLKLFGFTEAPLVSRGMSYSQTSSLEKKKKEKAYDIWKRPGMKHMSDITVFVRVFSFPLLSVVFLGVCTAFTPGGIGL